MAGIPPAPSPRPRMSELSQFMREDLNVPFSFAVLSDAHRTVRVREAAIMLDQAARHLGTWTDPPSVSAAGREVFFAYAHDLQRRAGRLELSARNHDPEQAAQDLEDIRATCNSCHRYFRPDGDDLVVR